MQDQPDIDDAPPRPSIPKNASAEAADLIRGAIKDGRFAPGERLREERLAAELGLGRTPVREALLLLGAEGLIDSAPNRSAAVRSYSPAQIYELYGLRAVLEGYACRLAASHMTERDAAALAASCARFDSFDASTEIPELISENGIFHDTIVAAAGLERLAVMVRSVIELPLVYKAFLWYSVERRMISARYHYVIYRALADRDGERAELVMRAHVLEARDVLSGHLRTEADGDGDVRPRPRGRLRTPRRDA